jgi:hypothetical protein
MQIPGKEDKMSVIKSLVGRKMTKDVKFMGENVKISKLKLSEVMEIQEHATKLKDDDAMGIQVLTTVIRSSVEGADELSDEDFQQFPMDELAKLSNEIMKFSGVQGEQGK